MRLGSRPVLVLGIMVLAGASACTPRATPPPATAAPTASPFPTATPTATPFPTSTPQDLVVPGDVEGTKFVAEESGLHHFEIAAGAYSPCPAHVAFPSCGRWITLLGLYINREIEWSTQPDSAGFTTPVNEDSAVGDSAPRDTVAEAEAASAGISVDIPLHQGEFVWFLPSDAKGTYHDNSGAVTLRVSRIAPLP